MIFFLQNYISSCDYSILVGFIGVLFYETKTLFSLDKGALYYSLVVLFFNPVGIKRL